MPKNLYIYIHAWNYKVHSILHVDYMDQKRIYINTFQKLYKRFYIFRYFERNTSYFVQNAHTQAL